MKCTECNAYMNLGVCPICGYNSKIYIEPKPQSSMQTRSRSEASWQIEGNYIRLDDDLKLKILNAKEPTVRT